MKNTKNRKSKCRKKPYESKFQAKGILNGILKRSKKNPQRNEVTVYQCEICDKWHLASIISDTTNYIPTHLKGKTYFEIQKEKWGGFLQKYSSKKARL